MKKLCLVYVSVLLSFCLSLFGCQSIIDDTRPPNNTLSPEPSESESNSVSESNSDTYIASFDEVIDDYSILKKDGKSYIVFEDREIDKYDVPQPAPEMIFSSLGDIKKAVETKSLTTWDKYCIFNYIDTEHTYKTRLERHVWGIEICDLDNLYQPTNSSSFEIAQLEWYVGGYIMLLDGPDMIQFIFGTEYHLKNDRFYPRFINMRGTNEITRTEQIGDYDIETTYYTYESDGITKANRVTYTLKNDTKTMKVYISGFATDMDNISNVYDITSPPWIMVECSENDVNYLIKLYDLENIPSPDWFLSWGIEKYIPQ